MSFRPRAFPELRDMSKDDGRQIVEAVSRRRPRWMIFPFVALAILASEFLRPHILIFLEAYLSHKWADYVSLFVCVTSLLILYDFVQRCYWDRAEIRRIRGSEPNNELHQTGER